MIQANIHEAKTQLSYLIDQALSGKRVIIAKRNIPLIEFTPLKKKKGKRKLGLYAGKIIIKGDIRQPLPDEITESFYHPTVPHENTA